MYYLPLLSKSNGVLAGIVLVLAALGGAVLVAVRRGWRRNGYFTIVSTTLIVFGVFIVFQTVGGLLAVMTGGLSMDGGNLTLLADNGIAQLAIMLVGTVLLSRAAGQDPFAVFRLEGFSETPGWAYVLSVPIILLAQVAGSAAAVLWTGFLRYFPDFYAVVNQYESRSDKQMEQLVTAHGLLEFILIFLFVAVVPAFAEETLFRGFAQSNIERSGRRHTRPAVALIVASVLFAAIHASLFKFPGLLALGLALGWMAWRTNNLFVGSLGHAANNGLIVMALYLRPDTGDAASNMVGVDQMTVSAALMALAGSLPFLALFLFLFHRVTVPIEARQFAERELQIRLDSEHYHDMHDGILPDTLPDGRPPHDSHDTFIH